MDLSQIVRIKNISILIILCVILIIVYKKNILNDYYALLILIISVLFIMFSKYFIPANNIGKDKNLDCIIGENKKYSGIFFSGCFEYWHVYHLLLWIIIGLLSPYHYWIALGLSIGWETCEHIYFKNDGSCTDFSCGRVEDVVLNMGGYFLGSYMRTKQNESTQIKTN